MTTESIGKFITDNHDFLGQCVLFATLVTKMGRDYFVGKKKDREREEEKKRETVEKEKAQVERKQIIETVNANTALTAHTLDAVAKSQGKSVEELIVGADRGLDDLLSRFMLPYESENVNESGRTRPRKP